LDILRNKLYDDNYDNFEEFNKDLDEIKKAFADETGNSLSSEKWIHFNEISEGLYKLAGETITNKIN